MEYHFSITTPMFLGDAQQQAHAIRPTSIKGALRFWWRALYWHQHQSLDSLHREESRLFGAMAGNASGGGQGIFLLSVSKQNVHPDATPLGKAGFERTGLRYFMGQGLTARDALRAGGTFSIRLIFRPCTPEKDREQIHNTMRIFELLGALGSRGRHGWGSVAGATLMQQDDYIQAVQDVLKPTLAVHDEPPFTAFSAASRVDISLHSQDDALTLLNRVGEEQQLYRSYGLNGWVAGKEAEKKFDSDHGLMFRAIGGITPNKAPERVIFGLPHNYFFSSTKKKGNVNYVVDNQKSRRASPLFLHIHPLQGGRWIAVHTLMPAQFLPHDAEIEIEIPSLHNKTYSVKPQPHWEKLHDYLNRTGFTGRGTIHGIRK